MIEIFDNTSLSYLKLCPRKYYYRMVLDLVPAVSDSYKAEFGIAVHLAWDVWYRTGSIEGMDKAFTEHWMAFDGQDIAGIRTMTSGLNLLKRYRETYQTEPFDIIQVEVGGSFEISTKYIYCARFDGLIKWTAPGLDGNMVLENKTSARKGYLITRPNAQLDGYVWAARQITKEPVIGSYLNQVYITGKIKLGVEFVREVTLRTDEEIDEWKRDAIRWMDLCNDFYNEGHWPCNSNSCTAFGRKCEYILLCTSLDKDQLIRLMFKKLPWSSHPEIRKCML